MLQNVPWKRGRLKERRGTYSVSSIVDKAGASVVVSAGVEARQGLQLASLGVAGDPGEGAVSAECPVVSSSDDILITHLHTTGSPGG